MKRTTGPGPNPSGLCQCGCGQPTSLARSSRASKGHVAGQPVRFISGHHSRKSHLEYVVDPDTGCWLWQKAITTHGYGSTHTPRPNPVKVFAHRMMWERVNGPIPQGEGYHGTCVLHHCDNPSCVNPEHLFLGTHQDNMRDMIAKGRHRWGDKSRKGR